MTLTTILFISTTIAVCHILLITLDKALHHVSSDAISNLITIATLIFAGVTIYTLGGLIMWKL